MPITLAAATGCHGDEPAAPFSINADLHTGSEEGEFFGRLLLNGTPIADTGYTISLVPADPATASRLRYPDPTMWVNPAGYANSGNMWDFFDPKAGGNCGSLARYLSGNPQDTIPDSTGGAGQRLYEIHRPGPGQPIPTNAAEKHCIRPGRYRVTISGPGGVEQVFDVDYLPIVPSQPGASSYKPVWNITSARAEALEAVVYDDTTNLWQDLVLHRDATITSYVDTVILDVQNALSNPALDTFLNHPTPAGSELDHFRFSVARSQSGWHVASQGTSLILEVQSGQVMLDGPTFITDKAAQLYTSNTTARWFERYNPAWTWYQATATPQPTFTRIWPAGDYTVELRQDTTVSGVLRRGRLHITVCHDECGEAAAPAIVAAAGATSDVDWELFGGGPWISWGTASAPRGVRFYDLWGAHDAPGFSATSWVDDSAAAEAVPGTAWRVDRVRRDLSLAAARAIDFTVTAPTTATYVFGLAVDPDLGADPADDVGGYDRTRGLTYVTDASGAVGFLLRTGGDDALVSLQEYGVGRWAPRLATEIWAAQRTRGVNLVRQPRDVQLVLSADARTGSATFTVVLLRAANLAALQALADESLTRLDDGGSLR